MAIGLQTTRFYTFRQGATAAGLTMIERHFESLGPVRSMDGAASQIS